MNQWFVIHTHPKSESKANFHLARQGFKTYLPCYLKWRRHARRIDTIKSPLFPRYLFVNLDIKRDQWRSIFSTVGVESLVCFGEKPASISNDLINSIAGQEDEAGIVKINKVLPFKCGDQVRFLSGPMESQTGTYSSMKDEERVEVLLNLLGRPIKVLTDIDAIATCA